MYFVLLRSNIDLALYQIPIILCKAAGRGASAGVFKSVPRDSDSSLLKSVRLVAFVGLNLYDQIPSNFCCG